MIESTDFEGRHRRAKLSTRDLVRFRAGPELAERLVRLEGEVIASAVAMDPACADFLEWYAEEARKYGWPIRAGLAALYWTWSEPDPVTGDYVLDPDDYALRRDVLAEEISTGVFDNEIVTGRGLIQELIWWSSGDWVIAEHLVIAVTEFSAYRAAGKMPDWRRRRRRRLSAARRRLIKEAFLSARLPWPVKGQEDLDIEDLDEDE